MSFFRGIMESFPDGQWDIQNSKMITLNRTVGDSTEESIRVVLGHFTHKGDQQACLILGRRKHV
jgi:hypothetical protein